MKILFLLILTVTTFSQINPYTGKEYKPRLNSIELDIYDHCSIHPDLGIYFDEFINSYKRPVKNRYDNNQRKKSLTKLRKIIDGYESKSFPNIFLNNDSNEVYFFRYIYYNLSDKKYNSELDYISKLDNLAEDNEDQLQYEMRTQNSSITWMEYFALKERLNRSSLFLKNEELIDDYKSWLFSRVNSKKENENRFILGYSSIKEKKVGFDYFSSQNIGFNFSTYETQKFVYNKVVFWRSGSGLGSININFNEIVDIKISPLLKVGYEFSRKTNSSFFSKFRAFYSFQKMDIKSLFKVTTSDFSVSFVENTNYSGNDTGILRENVERALLSYGNIDEKEVEESKLLSSFQLETQLYRNQKFYFSVYLGFDYQLVSYNNDYKVEDFGEINQNFQRRWRAQTMDLSISNISKLSDINNSSQTPIKSFYFLLQLEPLENLHFSVQTELYNSQGNPNSVYFSILGLY